MLGPAPLEPAPSFLFLGPVSRTHIGWTETTMERIVEIEDQPWRVVPLPDEVRRVESDPWHFARVRFEPLPPSSWCPREAWLRLEEDVPARDVLDQYDDEALIEAFLVAEEVRGQNEDD